MLTHIGVHRTRDILAFFKIQPSTWHATGRHSTSHMLNLWPTQSSQQAPQLPTARNYVPPTPLLAKHGTPTRWSSHHHTQPIHSGNQQIYYAVLDSPTTGLNAINLRTLVMHILNTYAQISQPDLDDNMTDFHSGINSGLPLAIYTRKQEKFQVFAADASVPISDKTMITTGTKHTLACGNMMLAWRKWKCHPIFDLTWPN